MSDESFWAIVPAAGVGRRVEGDRPKQYLHLHERPIIQWTLERLLEVADIKQVVVAISVGDEYWPDTPLSVDERIMVTHGGEQRCHSVLNGLHALDGHAAADDWVLVHDAARPCVRPLDIRQLMTKAASHPVGGILALPVRDTMKRADEQRHIVETVDRSNLWHALTPQMFRYAELRQALEQALADGFEVTDEASAMEHVGKQPLLVEGKGDNIKVTLPEDLDLASFYLQQQGLV